METQKRCVCRWENKELGGVGEEECIIRIDCIKNLISIKDKNIYLRCWGNGCANMVLASGPQVYTYVSVNL